MKKFTNYLNGMKSRCFVLFACLALMASVTSCSEDYFEDNVAEEQKQFSKAELIEQALSRMPKTRAGNLLASIVTTKTTVVFNFGINSTINIDWGDGTNTEVTKFGEYTHTYTDGEPSHGIFLEGSYDALVTLRVNKNELIFLDIYSNTQLDFVNCSDNQLDMIEIDYCPNLTTFWAPRNNIAFIDVSNLPNLRDLLLQNNAPLADIDVSKNKELNMLWVGSSKITDLDLSNNVNLTSIEITNLALSTINNLPLNDTSFSIFTKLRTLYMANTPFSSIDLSKNPALTGLNMALTSITRLDVSHLKIDWIDVASSELTDLIYTKDNLLNSYEFNIKGTPFEQNRTNVLRLISALPDRAEKTSGKLWCNSDAVNTFASLLERKNWKVNTYTRGVDNSYPIIYEREPLYCLMY